MSISRALRGRFITGGLVKVSLRGVPGKLHRLVAFFFFNTHIRSLNNYEHTKRVFKRSSQGGGHW